MSDDTAVQFTCIPDKIFSEYLLASVIAFHHIYGVSEQITVGYVSSKSPNPACIHVFLQDSSKIQLLWDNVEYNYNEGAIELSNKQQINLFVEERVDQFNSAAGTAHSLSGVPVVPIVALNILDGSASFENYPGSFDQAFAFTAWFSEITKQSMEKMGPRTLSEIGVQFCSEIVHSFPELSTLPFSNTDTSSAATLPQTFAQKLKMSCDQWNERPALECGDHVLTYGQLWQESAELASRLRLFGVNPSQSMQNVTFIGVFMERRVDLVVSMISCFISGAVYVPLDPSLGEKRLQSIMIDGNISIVICSTRLLPFVSKLFSQGGELNNVKDGDTTAAALGTAESTNNHAFYQEIHGKSNGLDVVICHKKATKLDGPQGKDSAAPAAPLANGAENHIGEQSSLNLAYCIYTSGSTGSPKGVVLRNNGALNTISHLADLFLKLSVKQQQQPKTSASAETQEGKAVLTGFEVDQFRNGRAPGFLFFNPISFDQSIKTLCLPLFLGGRLVILPGLGMEGISFDEIERTIETKDVSHCITVPTFFENLLNAIPQVMKKYVVLVNLGGETVTTALLKKCTQVLNKNTYIVNTYGPTETSISATAAWFRCGNLFSSRHVPIGSPLPHVRAWVLKQDKPCPVGVFGELHLGGSCVALGYTKEVLNAGKFVEYNNETVYCTGDLCYWTKDGDLVFLRRNDPQGKVNGVRIEPDEIRRVALRHPSVSSAAVLLTHDRAHLFIVKYSSGELDPTNCTSNTTTAAAFVEQEGDSQSVEVFVNQHIPSQVSLEVHNLPSLPLSSTGKIDHRGLRTWLQSQIAPQQQEQSGDDHHSSSSKAPNSSIDVKSVMESILKKNGLINGVADQYIQDEDLWSRLLRQVYNECQQAGVLCWSQIFGQTEDSAFNFSPREFVNRGVALHNAALEISAELTKFSNAHFPSRGHMLGDTSVADVGLTSIELMYLTQFVNHRYHTNYTPGILFAFGNYSFNNIGMRIALKQVALAKNSSTSTTVAPDKIDSAADLSQNYCFDWGNFFDEFFASVRDSANMLQLVDAHANSSTLVYKNVLVDETSNGPEKARLSLRVRLFLSSDITDVSKNKIFVLYLPTYHPFLADTQFVPQCVELASQGISTLMGYYRAPFLEGSIEDAVCDICSLIAWIRRNITSHYSKTAKIFVAGASSSGYLALQTLFPPKKALLNVEEENKANFQPDGLILYNTEFGLKSSTMNVIDFQDYKDVCSDILLLHPEQERENLTHLYRLFMETAGKRCSLGLFPGEHGSFNYKRTGYLASNEHVASFLQKMMTASTDS